MLPSPLARLRPHRRQKLLSENAAATFVAPHPSHKSSMQPLAKLPPGLKVIADLCSCIVIHLSLMESL